MNEQMTKPIVFLAFANEQEEHTRYLRTLAEEARRLRRALEQAEAQGLCRLEVRTNATLNDIRDVFRKYDSRVALFHFGGHADSFWLLFEAAGGKSAAIDATGFAEFLAQQAGLQLVFLNACSTAGQVAALQAAGVPVVIATAQDIPDVMATDFAGEFYQSLATGANSISKAFAEATALVKAGQGGDGRNLYPVVLEQTQAEQSLWQLYTPSGAAENTAWTLQFAANDPLFGLPALPKLDLPETPYRHLEWFRREDAEIFFGRGHEIAELYQRATATDDAPIILFYGQSGVGKSSVLAAGLLPRLVQKQSVIYQRRDQAKGLTATLAVALSTDDAANLSAAWRAAEMRAAKPLTIILDQVEESFTRPNLDLPDEMDAFLAVLKEIFLNPDMRPQGRLILSFRKEWLAEIEARLKEHGLSRTKVFLERLNQAGIVEAIAGPVRVPRLRRHYSLTVADDLPDLIADDLLADPGSPVAPMLQILLTGLWTAAKAQNYDHPCFDRPLYDKLRGQGLGLDDFLTRQLTALHAQQAPVVESGLALDLLAYHTTPLGTAEQRKLTELAETYRHQAAVLPNLVQQCRDLYLLVDPSANQPDQPPASRLTHDTLAPHVRKRFEESDAPGQRARRILESRLFGSPYGTKQQLAPLGDTDLDVVEAGRTGMRAREVQEEELVQISRADQARRQQERKQVELEREQSRQRELKQAQDLAEEQRLRVEEGEKARRSLRRRLILVTVAVAISVIAFAAASWFGMDASRQRDNAETALVKATVAQGQAEIEAKNAVAAKATAEANEIEARIALARQLAAQSELVLNQYPGQSLLLAAESLQTFPGLAGDQALRRGLAVLPRAVARMNHQYAAFASFSPDGRWIVSQSNQPWYEGLRKFEIWEVVSGQKISLPEQNSPIQAVAFSSSGNIAATASDNILRLWNPGTWEEIAHLTHREGTQIFQIIFSPDGTWLVSLAMRSDSISEAEALVWHIGPWNKVASLDFEEKTSFALFSAHGQWLAIASGKKVKVWNTETWQEVLSLEQSQKISVLTFSSDEKLVATGNAREPGFGIGKNLIMASSPSGSVSQLPSMIQARSTPLLSAQFAHISAVTESTQFVSGEVQIWDLPTGKEIARKTDDKRVVGAVFSSDTKWLVVGSDDEYSGKVTVWEWATDKVVNEISLEQEKHIEAMILSADGQAALTWGPGEPIITVWEIATGNIIASLDLTGYTGYIGGSSSVTMARLSLDGKWLVSGSGDGIYEAAFPSELSLWETNTWQRVSQIIYEDDVSAVDISPDGQRILAVNQDAIQVWESVTRAELMHTPEYLYQSQSTSDSSPTRGGLDFALSDDGNWVASGSDDNAIRVWETATGTEVVRLSNADPIDSLMFSPDGQWLASSVRPESATNSNASSTELHLWKVRSWQEETRAACKTPISFIRFTPDAKQIACVGENIIHLLQTATGQTISQFQHSSGRITAVAFSPNGRLLLSGADLRPIPRPPKKTTPAGMRHTTFVSTVPGELATVNTEDEEGELSEIRMWEVATEREIFQRHYPGKVSSVSFSPDGSWILVEVSKADKWYSSEIVIWKVDASYAVTPIMDGISIIKVSFSPSGNYAELSTNNGTEIWDIKQDRKQPPLSLNESLEGLVLLPEVTIFGPDERYIVSGGGEVSESLVAGDIHVWEVATGNEVARMAHEGPVQALNFSQDGQWLVSGSGTWRASPTFQVSVWKVEGWQEVARIENLPAAGCVNNKLGFVRFGSDDRSVIAGFYSDMSDQACKQIWAWAWQPHDLIAEACSRVANLFTETDEHYKRVCGE